MNTQLPAASAGPDAAPPYTELARLSQLQRDVIARYYKLLKRIEDINQRIAALEKLAPLDAYPVWRDPDHPTRQPKLYLVTRMVHGTRSREYIGTDKTKQEQALQRIAAYKQREQYRAERAALRTRLDQARRAIETARYALGAEQARMW